MTIVVGQLITRDGFARRSYLYEPPPERVGVSIAYRRRPAELRRRHFAIDG